MEQTIICDDKDEDKVLSEECPQEIGDGYGNGKDDDDNDGVSALKRAPLGRVQINKTGTC